MRTAEAPPPPLQMEAIPSLPFFSFKTVIKDMMILAPDILLFHINTLSFQKINYPTGCPKATAPP